MGSDWGSGSGLGHGGRWDGSIRCRGSWDGWGGEGSGLDEVLWGSGNIRGGWLGDGLMSGNSVLVTGNNGSNTGLDGSLSNDSVFNSVLNNCWSSGVAVVGLSNTSVSKIAKSNVGGGSSDIGHEGTGNHKSVHVF